MQNVDRLHHKAMDPRSKLSTILELHGSLRHVCLIMRVGFRPSTY